MDHAPSAKRSPQPPTPSSLSSPKSSPLRWCPSGPEKSGVFSGARPPGGHSRLSSADSGIQVDSAWDSLTRSPSKATADCVSAPTGSALPPKTLYSTHSQPLPSSSLKTHTVRSTPNLSPGVRGNPPAPHADPKLDVTISCGMTSSEAVRARTLHPDVSSVTTMTTTTTTTTSGGTRLKPLSKKPGTSRLINIKLHGHKASHTQDGTDRDRTTVTAKIHGSSEAVQNTRRPQTLKKDVPATVELAQSPSPAPAPGGSRVIPLTPDPSKTGSSVSASEQCKTSGSGPSPERGGSSGAKRLEVRPAFSTPAEAGKGVAHKVVVSDRTSLDRASKPKSAGSLQSPRRCTSTASVSLSQPPSSEASNPISLTLLSSTTPVIPTLPPSEGQAAPPPPAGEWVAGGRKGGVVFSSRTGISLKHSDRHPQTRPASGSSPEACNKTLLASRGFKISQRNLQPPWQLSATPVASQNLQPKVLSVPVHFVKSLSNDDDRAKDLKVRENNDSNSNDNEVSEGKVQLVEKSPDTSSSHPPPPPPLQPPPPSHLTNIITPTSESPQQSLCATASSQLHGTAPPQQTFRGTAPPQTFCSKPPPGPPHPSPRPRPLSVTPSSPAPSLPAQPIPVKHVGAKFKPDSAPPPSSSGQSKTPVVSNGAVTSGSTVVTSSPSVWMKLLEMTSAVRGKEGGGGREGVERRIPVVDARRRRRRASWGEQRKRMDSALSWLKDELQSLRAMDWELMTQFQRCQETIDSLKQQQQQQQQQWGEGEGSDMGWGWGWDVDEEEGDWEDWEIAEFEKRWAEHRERNLLENSDVNQDDVNSSDTTSSIRESSSSPFTQDVEASV